MTEAEKEKLAAADRAREDGGDAGNSEEIPAWADKLVDAVMKRVDARMDALEKDRKDAARKDEGKDNGEDPTENTQGEPRKDEEGKGEERRPLEAADGKRKDAESEEERKKRESEGGRKANEELEGERKEKERLEKDRKDAESREREDRARKDAAYAAADRASAAKIAELEARINAVYKEDSIENRNALAETRARADGLYQALTGQPASQPMPGETPIAYRKRMADGLRKYSDRMKDVRVDALTGEAFAVIEDHIYTDAEAAIRSDAVIPAGQLRAIVRNDRGRERTEYVGDASVTWEPFSAGSHRVVKLNRPTAH